MHSDGISSQSLPVTVTTGKARFKADLRLRAQVGAEADLDVIGIGAGAVVGIYANILELVAEIESTPTCLIETREFIDLNVGAYAHLDVVVDYKTLGPVPTVSTTLLTAPTATQCWKHRDAQGGGAPVTLNLTSVGSLPSPTATTLVTTSTLANGEASWPVIRTISAPPVTAVPTSESVLGLPVALVTPKYPMVNATATAGPASTLPLRPTAAQNSAEPVINSTTGPAGELVTSTVYSMALYTITMCAAGVVNCPAAYQQEVVATRTVNTYTTVCPAGADVTPPAAAPGVSMLEVEPVYHIMTQAVPLVPIVTPIVATFVPPSPVPKMPAAAAVAPAVGPVLAPAIAQAVEPAAPPVTGATGRYNATSVPSVTILPPGPSSMVYQPTAYPAKPISQPVTAGAASAGVGLLHVALTGAVGVVAHTLML